MKNRLIIATALLALVVAGCSKQETATPSAVTPAAAGPRTIEVTGNDAMKFNVTAIQAAVGEEFKITLTNVGTMPKQAMGHNLVVLKPGTDVAAYVTAAAAAQATEYIPAALAGQVVAHTKLLGPKQADSIVLKLTEAGDYPYVCSFPAHYQIGMKGVITVK
jgi:azurin